MTASPMRSPGPSSIPTRRRCSRSCSARTTRSSPPTTGSTRSPPTSSSTARRGGNPANRCSSASTRSPAPACISASCRAGSKSLIAVRAAASAKQDELAAAADNDERERLATELRQLQGQAHWLEETIVEIIISEAQNEVADFQKWGFDIIPHRALMKQGFEVGEQAGRCRDGVQEPGPPVPRRHRLRHVADRLRR